jgi:hypothetical protein
MTMVAESAFASRLMMSKQVCASRSAVAELIEMRSFIRSAALPVMTNCGGTWP